MAGHRAHEVQSQVTEGHKGVAKKTETLPCQDESALVLLSLLRQKRNQFGLEFLNEKYIIYIKYPGFRVLAIFWDICLFAFLTVR